MENDIFYSNLQSIGITVNESQRDSFEQYYKVLIEWNEVMNLTAITEYQDVMLKHFVDSLAVQKAFKSTDIELDLNDSLKVIDIGTGAGFPGIPLKIVFHNLDVTLLDSLNKRIKFLDEVIKTLSLKGIQPIHGRAEDYAGQKDYRGRYDLCVSRAVANLSTLSEYCLPYVRQGGYFVSYKSGNVEDELRESIRAVKILGGEIVNTTKLTLPGSDIDRSFVIIKKIKQTPTKYPRKAGLPSKEPIK